MEHLIESDPDEFFRDYKERIVTTFREGDNSYFEGIYNDLSSRLTNYAKRIVKSPLDAQDIVANAFLKLLVDREKMTSYEYLRSWMYFVVRNEAIDYLRSQTRLRKAMEVLYYLSDDSDSCINSEKQKTFLLGTLAKAIEELPSQQRTVLRLYFFEEKETHEIAEMLDLSNQTVLNHKSKALKALRKTLPKQIGE